MREGYMLEHFLKKRSFLPISKREFFSTEKKLGLVLHRENEISVYKGNRAVCIRLKGDLKIVDSFDYCLEYAVNRLNI